MNHLDPNVCFWLGVMVGVFGVFFFTAVVATFTNWLD